MRLIRGRKRFGVLVLVPAVALVGAATAYWTQGGTGTGTAETGTTTGIVVNQTSAVAGLYPGGPAQPLSGDFDNPNAGDVFITSVTAEVQAAWSSQGDVTKPACTAGDFLIAGTAPVNAEIASGVGVGGWSGLTIALVNGATNQDNCKDVVVPLEYTAN